MSKYVDTDKLNIDVRWAMPTIGLRMDYSVLVGNAHPTFNLVHLLIEF
jgi:hypothetical protein